MWILPISEEHLAFFTELSTEITQNKGTAFLLSATFLPQVNAVDAIELFNQARGEEYKEFLEKCTDFFKEIEKETKVENFSFGELEENEEEYTKLAEWLQKISQRDFFSSHLKDKAEQKLRDCFHLLEEFSTKIYSTCEKEGAI
jgi:hypothetical protein